MKQETKFDYLADERVRLSKFTIGDGMEGNFKLKEGGSWPFNIIELFEDGTEDWKNIELNAKMPVLHIKNGTINKAGLFAQLPRAKEVVDVHWDNEHGGFSIRIASKEYAKKLKK